MFSSSRELWVCTDFSETYFSSIWFATSLQTTIIWTFFLITKEKSIHESFFIKCYYTYSVMNNTWEFFWLNFWRVPRRKLSWNAKVLYSVFIYSREWKFSGKYKWWRKKNESYCHNGPMAPVLRAGRHLWVCSWNAFPSMKL